MRSGVARTRGTGRDDRPAFATPAPRARAVSARALEPRRLVRLHLADRGGRAAPVGQGAADARARSWASRPTTSRPARRSATPTSASFGSPTPSSSCASPTTRPRPRQKLEAAARRGGGRRATPSRLRARTSRSASPRRPPARNADAIERLEAGLELSPVSPSGRPDVFATLGRAYAATVAAGQGRRGVRALPRRRSSEDAPEDLAAQVRFTTYLSYALTDLGDLDRAQCGARRGARQGRCADGRLLARAALLVARAPDRPAGPPGRRARLRSPRDRAARRHRRHAAPRPRAPALRRAS